MRYPPRMLLVEQSRLPVRRTMELFGLPRSTFYRWYDQYKLGGPEALADGSSLPGWVWNPTSADIQPRSLTWRWRKLSCRFGN